MPMIRDGSRNDLHETAGRFRPGTVGLLMRGVLTAFLILLPPLASEASAQLQVTRNVVLNPFADRSRTDGFLAATGVLAELNRGFGSTGGELAWDAKVGGFFEIYRWDSTAALTLLLCHEMIGNDRNDISFNPRSARWEEALVFTYNARPILWQLGGIHQCKHDIDNSDPVDSDVPGVEGISKRVVILSGIYGSAILPRVELAEGLRATAYLRGDYYPASSEYRFPGNSLGMRWDEITGNLSAGFRAAYELGGSAEGYILGWATLSLPGDSLISGVNYRSEAGVRWNGGRGSFQLYGAYEHFFDDLSTPVPQSSSVLFVGMRLGNLLFL